MERSQACPELIVYSNLLLSPHVSLNINIHIGSVQGWSQPHNYRAGNVAIAVLIFALSIYQGQYLVPSSTDLYRFLFFSFFYILERCRQSLRAAVQADNGWREGRQVLNLAKWGFRAIWDSKSRIEVVADLSCVFRERFISAYPRRSPAPSRCSNVVFFYSTS